MTRYANRFLLRLVKNKIIPPPRNKYAGKTRLPVINNFVREGRLDK
jgi:hypothetical protein